MLNRDVAPRCNPRCYRCRRKVNEKEREIEGAEGRGKVRRMNDCTTKKESSALSRLLALFRDNPLSLRRFSIFTTSFELAADSVADGHSKYSRNLGIYPRGPGGKDAR